MTGGCPVMDKFTGVHRFAPDLMVAIHRLRTSSGYPSIITSHS